MSAYCRERERERKHQGMQKQRLWFRWATVLWLCQRSFSLPGASAWALHVHCGRAHGFPVFLCDFLPWSSMDLYSWQEEVCPHKTKCSLSLIHLSLSLPPFLSPSLSQQTHWVPAPCQAWFSIGKAGRITPLDSSTYFFVVISCSLLCVTCSVPYCSSLVLLDK